MLPLHDAHAAVPKNSNPRPMCARVIGLGRGTNLDIIVIRIYIIARALSAWQIIQRGPANPEFATLYLSTMDALPVYNYSSGILIPLLRTRLLTVCSTIMQ